MRVIAAGMGGAWGSSGHDHALTLHLHQKFFLSLTSFVCVYTDVDLFLPTCYFLFIALLFICNHYLFSFLLFLLSLLAAGICL